MFQISLFLNKNIELYNKFKRDYSCNKNIINNKLNKEFLLEDIDIFHMSDKVFSINHCNTVFDCFFHLNSFYKDKLYVFLSGGREFKCRDKDNKIEFNDTLPRFKRWSFYSKLDGHLLVVDDPMYKLFDSLRIGWFYGTRDISYTTILSDIVLKFLSLLSISKLENLCFYGSSSGGYASILMASLINGSKCISINPQIILSNDPYVRQFQSITSNDISVEDQYNRNNLVYLVGHAEKSKYVIVQNLFDDVTIKQHFVPFCRSYGFYPKYSISTYKNIITYVYAAKGGM